MEKLYLIAGKARNGKDTVGSLICDYYKDKKVIRLSYGAYPKNYVKLITGWDGSDDSKPRDFLSEVSMKARKINSEYMIRRMEEDINILKDYCDVIIISDARMVEEMDMPKRKFKETCAIRVVRPGFESPLTMEQQAHVLETALDNYEGYDHVIYNDGSLDDLKLKVKNFIEGA